MWWSYEEIAALISVRSATNRVNNLYLLMKQIDKNNLYY
jgi:hypothetical protein